MTIIINRSLSDEVLNKTMMLFWEKGYSKTSIADINRVTKLNRAALYKYYGGKDQLFVEMLKRFRANLANHSLSKLQNSSRGIAEIHTFFENILIAYSAGHLDKLGCFMISAASEMSLYNKSISFEINDFIKTLGESFERLLLSSKKDGVLKHDINACNVANFLIGNFIGLMALCRTTVPKKIFESHVCVVMDFLKSISTNKLSKKRK